MTIQQTVYQLLVTQAKCNPDGIAIVAADRPPLTYARLQLHVQTVVQLLNTMGVGQNDRVAIVLPTGPEMATAF